MSIYKGGQKVSGVTEDQQEERISELVVQTTGDDTTVVMSQDAVTRELLAIAAGSGVDIVQTTGSSTTAVMSQDAVTRGLNRGITNQQMSSDLILNSVGAPVPRNANGSFIVPDVLTPGFYKCNRSIGTSTTILLSNLDNPFSFPIKVGDMMISAATLPEIARITAINGTTVSVQVVATIMPNELYRDSRWTFARFETAVSGAVFYSLYDTFGSYIPPVTKNLVRMWERHAKPVLRLDDGSGTTVSRSAVSVKITGNTTAVAGSTDVDNTTGELYIKDQFGNPITPKEWQISWTIANNYVMLYIKTLDCQATDPAVPNNIYDIEVDAHISFYFGKGTGPVGAPTNGQILKVVGFSLTGGATEEGHCRICGERTIFID